MYNLTAAISAHLQPSKGPQPSSSPTGLSCLLQPCRARLLAESPGLKTGGSSWIPIPFPALHLGQKTFVERTDTLPPSKTAKSSWNKVFTNKMNLSLVSFPLQQGEREKKVKYKKKCERLGVEIHKFRSQSILKCYKNSSSFESYDDSGCASAPDWSQRDLISLQGCCSHSWP